MESKLKIGGTFHFECFDKDGNLKWAEDTHNLVVNQGLDFILNVLLHNTTQVHPWYVGIFEGNYTPVATDTAASFTSNSTESSAYSEGVRQTYTDVVSSGQSITNSAAKATFSINASKNIYGAFMQSVSTIGATTGTLLCAARFSAARSVVSGDQILVTYTLSAASA